VSGIIYLPVRTALVAYVDVNFCLPGTQNSYITRFGIADGRTSCARRPPGRAASVLAAAIRCDVGLSGRSKSNPVAPVKIRRWTAPSEMHG